MQEETYEAGPDLSAHFPKRQLKKDIPLPAQFDSRCTKCKEPMERMPVSLCTEVLPYAQFHCTPCGRELYIFEAPRRPYLVWSDELYMIIQFSDFIKDGIAKRERDHERDLAREKAAQDL